MKVTHNIYKLLIIQSKTGELFNVIDVCNLVNQLIIAGAYPVHQFSLLAGTLDSDYNLMSFFPLAHKFYDHIDRVLKICAHTDDTVPVGLLHTVHR